MYLAIYLYISLMFYRVQNKSDDDDGDCFTPSHAVLYNQSCNPFSNNVYETLFLEKRNTIPYRAKWLDQSLL